MLLESLKSIQTVAGYIALTASIIVVVMLWPMQKEPEELYDILTDIIVLLILIAIFSLIIWIILAPVWYVC